MDFEKLLQSWGMEQWQFICFIFIPVFLVISAIYLIRRKKIADSFKQEHGNVSYLIPRIMNGTGELRIHSVDGEKPVSVTYQNKDAIMITPGPHQIISSVTLDKVQGALFLQTRGLSAGDFKQEKTEQEITVEEGQNYYYIFDADKFTYAIDEIN